MRRQYLCLLLACALSLSGCASSSSSEPGHKPKPGGSSSSLMALNLMRQGSVLLQQSRYEEALKRFEEADRIAPGNATVHNMKGLCLLRLERYDRALHSFEKALDLIPSFTDARNNRGATYLALGQYHLAEVDFLAVLGDNTYPHRWEVYYNLGMTYLEQRQLSAAEENFRRAITASVPVYEAYIRLAEIKQQQGETEVAIDLLEEALLKFPDQLETSLVLGRLLTQLGRKSEAETYLRVVIASSPNSPEAEEARNLLEGR
jgi:Tfp pilus assembly protein PilF